MRSGEINTVELARQLEVIDSRYRDFGFTLADVVADNASAARVALGRERFSPTGVDLARVQVTLLKNEQTVDAGSGADVLGHPASAVAWLANKLAETGHHLQAGDLVMPGALCNAHALADGDGICAQFEGLGAVQLHCI